MNYLGKGIYSASYASKILRIHPQKIRRWINGYIYYRNTEKYLGKPLIKSDFEYTPNDVIISFLDLAELLFIKEFIEHGISIQKIRRAALHASKMLNVSHPFAIKKMYTDGKSIFAKIAYEEHDTSLLDLVNSQFQFDKIIEPLLYECIDFDKYDCAERWWPLGKTVSIVLDPSRNMGQPILHQYNIRTRLIYELIKTNHNIREISEWYEVDEESIGAALDFEKGFAA
jgi:uncharacterized protein (DUF433 family)/DNA-binding transcriptional MerR regulator